MTQSGNEGLGAPMTERGLHLEPLPTPSTPPQAGHLGRRSSLIDEDQPLRAPVHPRLAVLAPHPSRTDDVSAIGFAGQQRLF